MQDIRFLPSLVSNFGTERLAALAVEARLRIGMMCRSVGVTINVEIASRFIMHLLPARILRDRSRSERKVK